MDLIGILIWESPPDRRTPVEVSDLGSTSPINRVESKFYSIGDWRRGSVLMRTIFLSSSPLYSLLSCSVKVTFCSSARKSRRRLLIVALDPRSVSSSAMRHLACCNPHRIGSKNPENLISTLAPLSTNLPLVFMHLLPRPPSLPTLRQALAISFPSHRLPRSQHSSCL